MAEPFLAEVEPMRLRDAAPGDRAFLLALYASTREKQIRLAGWPAEVRELFVRLQFEAQASDYACRHPGSRCQVIELHGAPAGRLWVAHGDDAVRVLDVSLLPPFRGRGIGSRCLRQLRDEALALQVPLELQVAVGSPARRLCERLGLRPVGQANAYQAMRWAPPAWPRRGIAASEALEAPQEGA
jgi:GNAT superfamily N-acetyltransferase